MFSHCWSLQEDKYLTSFNFCNFDPNRHLKKKRSYIWPEENKILVVKCVCVGERD